MKRRFVTGEVVILLETIGDDGLDRVAVDQIALDPAMSADARYWALLLLVFHRQFAAHPWCVQVIDRYMARFPADENEDLLTSLRQSMVEGIILALD
ncbi:MAG: hypothetical protein M3Y74_18265 [Chloroflexota bacterium]|nr:hypothetical protein [Chloroflexota bacterium]